MSAHESSTRPHTILLVDDEIEFLRLARAILSGHPDISVIGEANSGETALNLLVRHNPHAVVLDVQMPGLNGFQTARRMLELAPELSLIMVSAFYDPQYETLAHNLGATAFLPKKAFSAEAIGCLLNTRLPA